MSIRVRVFADLHVHPFKQFANYRLSDNSRRLEILSRFDSIVSSPDNDKFDLLIIAGDIFHEKTKVDVVSVVETSNIIKKSKIPILMCSGNHDQAYSGYSSLSTIAVGEPAEIRENFLPEDLAYYDTHITISKGDFSLVFNAVPYNDFHSYVAGGSFVGERLQKNEVLVSHGELSGVYGLQYGDSGVDVKSLFDNFYFSIIGHQHSLPRAIINPNSSKGGVLIPGAIIPHTFGETDCGYLWDIEFFADGEIRVTSHKFNRPQFCTIDLRNDNVDLSLYDFNSADYYRIIIPPNMDVPPIPITILAHTIVVHGDENVGRVDSAASDIFELSPSALVNEYFMSLVNKGLVDDRLRLRMSRFGNELVSEGSNIDSLCEVLEREDKVLEDED